MLYLVSLMHGGISVEWLGGYESHQECIYAMQEAEIEVYIPNEGMLCLLEPPGFGKLY